MKKIREAIRKAEKRFISTIMIHEFYQLTLQCEGQETAILRTHLLEKEFKVATVNAEIAKSGSELRHKYRLSMADSIIAATALLLNATCISNDPHFKSTKEIKTTDLRKLSTYPHLGLFHNF
ncbi:MAG: PIN domain-containing protein [Candidatus Bathyarchaeota archaeon]|nr:PIN domain-containing protein [Candidatus Bathyarchaeota archaeon]